MRRAIIVHSSGNWPSNEIVSTVTLAFQERHRRRFRLIDDQNDPFLLDLAHATLLNDGDGLALEGGGFICVQAAAEPVADALCDSIEQAARVAWHIGNRHVPVQVLDGGVLRIQDDHVLVDMLRGLGVQVSRHIAPFAPESGAYHHHEH
ncbi:MAG: urease accessory protein UreE [Pseudomonadota bacterium]